MRKARANKPPQPPPEPPKAEPPPRAYKVQPTKGNSGRVGCFFTIVSWLLIGAISNQCRHNAPYVPASHTDPRGSSTNPYRIEWRQKGWLKLWQALPYGSYYNDRHGEPTQKLSAELPVADVFVDVPGGFADEEEALAALPLGCPSLPYQINWSAADAYEHFKNVPSHLYYVEWDGSIKQKP